MKYLCTAATDIDDLVGRDGTSGFDYGPLAAALKDSEELQLENSTSLSAVMLAKIRLLMRGLFIVETEETLRAGPGFRLILH